MLDGAPDLTNLESMSDSEREKVVDYFDNLVSTTNPDRSASPAPIHPCRRYFPEVEDPRVDLAQLLNKVQRHTRCTDGYCLRRKSESNHKECRFNFPMKLDIESKLSRNENSEFEYTGCSDISLP